MASLRQSARNLYNDVLAPPHLRLFILGRPWWSFGGVTLPGLTTSLTFERSVRSLSAEQPARKASAYLAAIGAPVLPRGAAIVDSVPGTPPPLTEPANFRTPFAGDLDGPVSGP